MLFGNTTSGAIKGTASQGPSKHADRALQKTVRRYFRDHRCLTDLVRCCVILDSIEVSSPCQRLPSYLNLIYVTCILKVHSWAVLCWRLRIGTQDVTKCLQEIFSQTVMKDVIVDHQFDAVFSDAINEGTDDGHLFKLTKVKDRFSSSDRLGYRDICLNLEVSHTHLYHHYLSLFCTDITFPFQSL